MIVSQPVDRSTRPSWLHGLRIYLGVTASTNLVWEVLHLPLYTIWTTGTLREKAFAAVHCTLGDVVIALSALGLALIIAGNDDWPHQRFWPVVRLKALFGLAYTVFSEWLNVVVRASWVYSDRMPIVSLLGIDIGLSPLLQWLVVPSLAFKMAQAQSNQ